MRKFFLYLGTIVSFSVSSMALDYMCEGKSQEEGSTETLLFRFIMGDPHRSDARSLHVDGERVHIINIEEEVLPGGTAFKGLVNSTRFRNFAIFIKNNMEFKTTMEFDQGSPQFDVRCTLLIP